MLSITTGGIPVFSLGSAYIWLSFRNPFKIQSILQANNDQTGLAAAGSQLDKLSLILLTRNGLFSMQR